MYAYRPTQHVSNFHPSSSPRLDFGPFHPLSLFSAITRTLRVRATETNPPTHARLCHDHAQSTRVCFLSPAPSARTLPLSQETLASVRLFSNESARIPPYRANRMRSSESPFSGVKFHEVTQPPYAACAGLPSRLR